MRTLLRCLSALFLLSCAFPAPAAAQARFDLAGPRIDIRVTRGGISLPIAEVPNLQPGDQLWLHPDLPSSQSVKYLLIAVFLRGTTNPPPDDWFLRIETWNRKVREEGVTVSVPAEAQQAILFLAPETGGDFSTLRSAVKGRPGIFVRADQDLIEAGFEQARIEKYLAEMKNVAPGDQNSLAKHSNLLARTLNLKPNPECFKRPLDQQYTCLTQTGTQTLLDDGHGQSVVAALSTGPGSDFINQASYTRLAGAGTYSAYVGAIVDLVRLTSGLHTAQFQYIPAIAFPDDASLNLRLNTPPSFHNPKSVIVIGLPAVQKPLPPPLRPAGPDRPSCLLNPRMVLPIEGAPLVFSTAFSHDLVLHLNIPPGSAPPGGRMDIPLVPDAFQGGLALAPPEAARRELPVPQGMLDGDSRRLARPPRSASSPPSVRPLPAIVTGTVKGMWGFDPYTGPTLPVQVEPGGGWHIAAPPDTPPNLIEGRPNSLRIASTGTACIENIRLEPEGEGIDWKLERGTPDHSSETAASAARSTSALAPPQVELTLNLQHASAPATIQIAIQQFGSGKPERLAARIFPAPASIQSVQYHAGDPAVLLSGKGLDQVKQLTFRNAMFLPQPPAGAADGETPSNSDVILSLAKGAALPGVRPDERLTARVQLLDGRSLDAPLIALPSRPAVTLLSRRVVAVPPSAIALTGKSEMPLGAQLLFFLKSRSTFPRTEQIEIASLDGSLSTRLNLKDGTLILQDAHTVLGTFDPLKIFGPSAFGVFRLRPVTADGTEGEWQPLATIVRLPTLMDLRCGAALGSACTLSGSALYLVDSVSPTASFASPTEVPEGFMESTLTFPQPDGPAFYLRLRDDPTVTQSVTMPMTPTAAPPVPVLPAASPRTAPHPPPGHPE